ncbi:hypothetical protein DTO207G8_5296 [Paecilomyces variotii]|nr:hypothetical protein DTO169C6_7674 [Paecilomyces variotii]KAJ9251616.1 hypothetical protein DTO207G8_5296 [Paecilomyces variotii]KAJ9383871.1 hypothetical protein DTO063F5_4975 [Paecilomyces variotii]
MELPGAEWFDTPRGFDYPAGLAGQASQRRPVRVTFDADWQDDSYVECRGRILLDSQNPRIILDIGDQGPDKPSAQMIFSLENSRANMGIEVLGNPAYKEIQNVREKRPRLCNGWNQTEFWVVEMLSPPFRTGKSWELEEKFRQPWDELYERAMKDRVRIVICKEYNPEHKLRREIHSWYAVLQSKGETFWAYKNAEPSRLADNSEGRYPELTWLWDKERKSYTKIIPKEPFFSTNEERKWRLIEGMRAERATQYQAITSIFSTERRHSFWFDEEQKAGERLIHVKIGADVVKEGFLIPEISPPVEAEFAFVDTESIAETKKTDLKYTGVVVHRKTRADFVLRSKLPEVDFAMNPDRVSIVVVIKPNLQAVDRQIDALQRAHTDRVWGDMEGHAREGYSLHKTILAHGQELNPNSDDYFELDIYKLSNVEQDQKEHRLRYILDKFPLDKTQRKAFNRSVRQIVAGIYLIQGPPGTGKTHTALVIILAFACRGIRVLIAAGSNKGVDNLAAAIVKAVKKDAFISSWCGKVIRFRSPAYQLSAMQEKGKGPFKKPSEDEMELLRVQMEQLVLTRAESEPERETTAKEVETRQKFLNLLQADRDQGLSRLQTKELKNCLEQLLREELQRAKIVATTLNNASQDILQIPGVFEPQVLVCDESGQCLEGDYMIAMTMPLIKVVILLGDLKQLPPTVISENLNNENAFFLKRSLMDRLYTAGGKLNVASGNAAVERVGNTWDEFTGSRHYFYKQGLEGHRRVFISVNGLAHHSDENLRCRDNLTVDACQGSEANIVIFLITKPSDSDGKSAGFVADSQRLNVALSRARKVLIIVGNLGIWNKGAIARLSQDKGTRFLVSLLRDVSEKGDTLTWCDRRTVTEIDQPANFHNYGYGPHDGDRRKLRTSTAQQPAAPQQTVGRRQQQRQQRQRQQQSVRQQPQPQLQQQGPLQQSAESQQQETEGFPDVSPPGSPTLPRVNLPWSEPAYRPPTDEERAQWLTETQRDADRHRERSPTHDSAFSVADYRDRTPDVRSNLDHRLVDAGSLSTYELRRRVLQERANRSLYLIELYQMELDSREAEGRRSPGDEERRG